MNEPTIIGEFSAKFEDLDIYFFKTSVQLIRIAPEENVLELAYTRVYDDLSVQYPGEGGRALNGTLIIYFMSQGEEKGLVLTFISRLISTSKFDNESASVLNKTIQYIFDWMKDYIKQNDIKDNTDTIFNLPTFKYAKEQFKVKFPD